MMMMLMMVRRSKGGTFPWGLMLLVLGMMMRLMKSVRRDRRPCLRDRRPRSLLRRCLLRQTFARGRSCPCRPCCSSLDCCGCRCHLNFDCSCVGMRTCCCCCCCCQQLRPYCRCAFRAALSWNASISCAGFETKSSPGY